MTEITFNGQEFDGAEEELGNLSDKLKAIVNDQAAERFGEHAIYNPSDINITPTVMEEPMFVVNTWHQTDSEFPGVLQSQDFTLKMHVEAEDVYVCADDEERKYRLTTRETLLLVQLGNIALMNTLLNQTGPE